MNQRLLSPQRFKILKRCGDILDFFTEMQSAYKQAGEKNYLNLGADT